MPERLAVEHEGLAVADRVIDIEVLLRDEVLVEVERAQVVQQATDGLDQSVTGNGTRYIGAMLSNSNTTTETAFTIPLTLDEGGSSGTDQFSDDDRSAAITYSSGWSQVADGTAYK